MSFPVEWSTCRVNVGSAKRDGTVLSAGGSKDCRLFFDNPKRGRNIDLENNGLSGVGEVRSGPLSGDLLMSKVPDTAAFSFAENESSFELSLDWTPSRSLPFSEKAKVIKRFGCLFGTSPMFSAIEGGECLT